MRTLSALHSGSGRVCRCPAGRSSGACEGVRDLQGGGFWMRDAGWVVGRTGAASREGERPGKGEREAGRTCGAAEREVQNVGAAGRLRALRRDGDRFLRLRLCLRLVVGLG